MIYLGPLHSGADIGGCMQSAPHYLDFIVFNRTLHGSIELLPLQL